MTSATAAILDSQQSPSQLHGGTGWRPGGCRVSSPRKKPNCFGASLRFLLQGMTSATAAILDAQPSCFYPKLHGGTGRRPRGVQGLKPSPRGRPHHDQSPRRPTTTNPHGGMIKVLTLHTTQVTLIIPVSRAIRGMRSPTNTTDASQSSTTHVLCA
jgi:hypothetical protein